MVDQSYTEGGYKMKLERGSPEERVNYPDHQRSDYRFVDQVESNFSKKISIINSIIINNTNYEITYL
jgi:hypothetical protein